MAAAQTEACLAMVKQSHCQYSQEDQSTVAMVQVMGPDDSYLIQYSEDVNSFWADTGSLALGACFKRAGQAAPPRVAVTEVWYVHALAMPVGQHASALRLCSINTCISCRCRGSSMGQWQRASRQRSHSTRVSIGWHAHVLLCGVSRV